MAIESNILGANAFGREGSSPFIRTNRGDIMKKTIQSGGLFVQAPPFILQSLGVCMASLGLELPSLDLDVQYPTNCCYNKVSKEVL